MPRKYETTYRPGATNTADFYYTLLRSATRTIDRFWPDAMSNEVREWWRQEQEQERLLRARRVGGDESVLELTGLERLS